jgi:TonB family protein
LFDNVFSDPFSLKNFKKWTLEVAISFQHAGDKKYHDRLFRWSVTASMLLLICAAWITALLRPPDDTMDLYGPQNKLLSISRHTLVAINAVARTNLSKRRVKVPVYKPTDLALREIDVPEPVLGSMEVGPEVEQAPGGPGSPEGTSRVRRPELMMLVPPVYPRDAEKKKIEGTVDLRVHVTITGTVDQVEIVNSSGLKSMDEAAVKAARKTRFRPAFKDGKRVSMWLNYPIQFALNKR